ncbi:MAG: hypothetical protein PHD98_00825 [Bacilli bacterium]|nr:hypothetical protein [Bacilli bacterium]MDD4005697.1 hypothetical protein [Bacilli bacterium]
MNNLNHLRHKHPRLFFLLLLITFNLLLMIISTLIVYFGIGGYANIWEAFSQTAITWFLDPGFYNQDGNNALKIISMITVLTAMISVNGGIIAFLSALLMDFLETIRSGAGNLRVNNHVLILNWSSEVGEILVSYYYDVRPTTVVILSEKPRSEVERAIKESFFSNGIRRPGRKLRYFVLQGDPLSSADLDWARAYKASSIIVLNANKFNNPSDNDIDVLKILMLLTPTKEQTVVAEVCDSKTDELIKSGFTLNGESESNIVFINQTAIMGFIIAQTMVSPYLSDIYAELLGFGGADFYTKRYTESISSYLDIYSHSLPVFTKKINGNSHLLIMADNKKDLDKLREKEYVLPSLIKLNFVNRQTPITHRDVLIVGDNEKSAFIIDSLKKYTLDSGNQIHVEQKDDISEKLIKEIASGQYSKVILLSSTNHNLDGDPDSKAITSLLKISKAAKDSQTSLIIELVNPRNAQITTRYGIKYSILTNRYISRIISQTSKNPVFYPFIEDLFTYDEESSSEESYEIYIHEASELISFEEKKQYVFETPSHLVRSFYEQNEDDPYIVIGIVNEEKSNPNLYNIKLFSDNLDSKVYLIVEPETKLIVVAK